VLDALTANETIRTRHAGAIADCLSSLLGTYSRRGSEIEAAQVKQRLSTHFPSTVDESDAGAPGTRLQLAQGATTQLDIDLDSKLQTRT
jgi:hypothetical protein